MDWANNDPDFHKHYYKPLIEARMQLPGYLLNGDNNTKLFGKDIKPEHRGRPRGKRKPKSTPSHGCGIYFFSAEFLNGSLIFLTKHQYKPSKRF
jgi:hypothetical protein